MATRAQSTWAVEVDARLAQVDARLAQAESRLTIVVAVTIGALVAILLTGFLLAITAALEGVGKALDVYSPPVTVQAPVVPQPAQDQATLTPAPGGVKSSPVNWTAVGAIAAAVAAIAAVSTGAAVGGKAVGALRAGLSGLNSTVGLIETRLSVFDSKFDTQISDTATLKGTVAGIETALSTGLGDVKRSVERVADSLDRLTESFDKKLDSQTDRFERRIDRLESREI